MTASAGAGVALAALGLAGTLVAARYGRRRLQFVTKPAASIGFVTVALGASALDNRYGRWVVAALVLSLLGDTLLLGRDRRSFLGGLAAFLLAHLAYVAAFLVIGVDPGWAVASAMGAAIVGVAVLGRLLPHLDRAMRGPVLAYVAIVSAMLALAVGTRGAGQTSLITIGASLFYVSDLFVARERFVVSSFVNRLVGLPLYSTGQILLALSAGH